MLRNFEDTRRFRVEPCSERELECMEKLSTTDYSIYSNKLETDCFEGRDTFVKMGATSFIQGGDLCVAIYTAAGDIATCVAGTHLHLVNCVLSIKFVLKYYKDDPSVGIREGDLFYINSALYGGIHNADQILFLPIFYQDELVAWVSTANHEGETGAIEPGGHPPTAKTKYEDGMNLPPFKIGEDDILKTDLLELIENQTRDPRMQTLDIKARLAAAQLVKKRVLELLEKKGKDFLIGLLRRGIEESAEVARKRIEALNDGVYRQVIFFDRSGYEEGLIRVACSVHKRGDRLTIDFTDTTPRVVGNFNTFPHGMIAMTACYFFQYFFWDLKPSGGIFSPIDFIFPKGCVFDADPEDAVSLGIGTVGGSVSTVHAACEKMLFSYYNEKRERTIAPRQVNGGFGFAGLNQYGQFVADYDQAIVSGCGLGAASDRDGLDASGFVFCPLGEMLDTEHVEIQYPFINLFRYKYYRDGFGIGKYRGGRVVVICPIVHGTSNLIGVSTGTVGSRLVPSAGLFGSYAPPPAPMIVVKKNNLEKLKENPDDIPYSVQELLTSGKLKGDFLIDRFSRPAVMLEEGDLGCFFCVGGTGYGDALERSPDLVMKDIREESISHWVAQNLHCVVYNQETLDIDYKKTEELRAQKKEERKRRGKPCKDFEKEWLKKRPKEEILRFFGPWPKPKKNPELIKM